MNNNSHAVTVKPGQLPFLTDLRLRNLLSAYLEPCTPSEAAKKLGMAANRVHYFSKRLSKAGLLRTVRREGRSCFYQVVAKQFTVPLEASPDALLGISSDTRKLLMALAELASPDPLSSENKEPIVITIKGLGQNSASSNDAPKKAYPQFVDVYSQNGLPPEAYERLYQKLKETIEHFLEENKPTEVKQAFGYEAFTLALIGCRGRIG
jgi:hypothetical protein